jgi:hypothetical protein
MPIDVYKDWLGIPESVPRPPDHYQLLRVAQFEDEAEKIRGHYKKLNAHVRKYATGKYSIQSQELLNELAKAMLCLTDPDRKRGYDESLGREFAVETDALGRPPLLETLITEGHISRDQKRDIESFASTRGLSERDAAVQMKLVDPTVAAQALARQLGYSYVDLEDMLPEDSVLDLVPRTLVKKHTFIPLFIDDGQILAACIDELEPELEDELRLRYGVPVRPVIATPRAVNQAIARHYAPGIRDEAAVREIVTSSRKQPRDGKPQKRTSTAQRRSIHDMTEAEQERRKQIGILILCASIFIPLLPKVLAFVSPEVRLFFLANPAMSWVPWIVMLVSGSLAAAFVFGRYWK